MKYLILFSFLSCSLFVHAQSKAGNEWITGGGGQRIIFTDTGIITKINTPFLSYFTNGNSNICDTNGKLILSSDGFDVYDGDDNLLDDGDSLVPEDIYIQQGGWSPSPQSSIFLPMDSGKYYFINSTFSNARQADCNMNNHCSFDLLLYNVIDMNANLGAGKVVQRMQPLMQNAELSKAQMMACRHGNGKDWWLLKQGSDSNIVFTFLFTQDSIIEYGKQVFNAPVWGKWDLRGQSVFNREGTQYASTVDGYTAYRSIFIADFDRCYGILSHPRVIEAPAVSAHSPNNPNALDGASNGLAYSPNGRFLYSILAYNIFQYDFQDNSWYHVAGLDTSWQKFQMYSTAYLGPDDKIYIGNWNGLSTQMSVINNPNGKGVNCNFCPRCLRTDSLGINATLGTPPCMPDYKLGARECYPLNVTQASVDINGQWEIYPNPTSGKLYFKGVIAQKKQLFSTVGQVILTTTGNEVDLSHLSKGTYFLRCNEQVKKVIVE